MVSIIIPIYNTKSEYLNKCIHSVINQTFNNIEIILVDDGSEQTIAQLCDQIAVMDGRIIVLHKQNGGVSSARNLGLRKAKGAYVAFVDADDWIEPQFIECLVNSLEKMKADLAVTGFKYEYEEKGHQCLKNAEETETLFHKYEYQEIWKQLLYHKNIGGFLCNKLYKRDKITKLLDERLYYSEDFVFTAEYCKNIKTMVFTNLALYHYRQSQENATNDFSFNIRIMSLLNSYKQLEKIYMNYAPEELDNIKCNTLKIALNLRARYKLNKINDWRAYLKIKEVINKRIRCTLLSKKVSNIQKLNILLTWIFPTILFRIKNKALGRQI